MAENQDVLKISIVPELDTKAFEANFKTFKTRMEGVFSPSKAPAGLMEAMFFPKKGSQSSTAVRGTVKDQLKGVNDELKNSLKALGNDSGVKSGFAAVNKGLKDIGKNAQAATIQVLALLAALQAVNACGGGGGGGGSGGGAGSGAGGGGGGGGAGGGAGGGGGSGAAKKPLGRRILGGIGRAALWGAGAVTKGLWQFATSAYSEAVGAYEATQMARLGAAPAMIPLGGDRRTRHRGLYSSGTYMGFTSDEAAKMQFEFSRAGLGRGREGARAGFELARGVGAEGITVAGGIMSRGGLTGVPGGADQAMRKVSAAFAVAVKTGLDEARVPEFLMAANQYAEQQIAITPDRKDFSTFVRELALVQERGGPGMAGRYGAAALGRADQAIKGASGVQQAFLMRAFNFGQGASFGDVMLRQERGIGGTGPGGRSNMMAVMEQLRAEYGKNAKGGLSELGREAFAGMGLGSRHMAMKFSEIYLQQKSGKLSPEDAQKKVKDIMDEEKTKEMPAVQVRAYQAMGNFGDVAKRLADRFEFMFGKGAGFSQLKDALFIVHKGLVNIVTPAINKFAETAKVFAEKGPLAGFVHILKGLLSGMLDLGKWMKYLAETIGFWFRKMLSSGRLGKWTGVTPDIASHKIAKYVEQVTAKETTDHKGALKEVNEALLEPLASMSQTKSKKEWVKKQFGATVDETQANKLVDAISALNETVQKLKDKGVLTEKDREELRNAHQRFEVELKTVKDIKAVVRKKEVKSVVEHKALTPMLR